MTYSRCPRRQCSETYMCQWHQLKSKALGRLSSENPGIPWSKLQAFIPEAIRREKEIYFGIKEPDNSGGYQDNLIRFIQ